MQGDQGGGLFLSPQRDLRQLAEPQSVRMLLPSWPDFAAGVAWFTERAGGRTWPSFFSLGLLPDCDLLSCSMSKIELHEYLLQRPSVCPVSGEVERDFQDFRIMGDYLLVSSLSLLALNPLLSM